MKRKTSNRQYATALATALQSAKPKEQGTVLREFARILMRHHKLHQAAAIIKEYDRVIKKQEGIEEVEVVVAREQDKKVMDKIKKMFNEESEIAVRIDESMLGGVKIKTADKILDGSVITQIKNLKKSLIR